MNILVVDDEEDARGLVKEFLEEKKAKVILASSSREALEKISQNALDLIISDISMPHEDGYELIRQVRSLSASVAGLPAAAVTAYAGAQERDRALAAGFQMHLAKPILPEALAHAVAKLAAVESA